MKDPNIGRFNRKKYLISRMLLWWLDVFPGRKKTLPLREKVKKILIIQSHLIGDIVMTVPVLRNIRRCYHNSKIILIANPSAQEVLKHERAIDELIAMTFPWSSYNYSMKTIIALIKIVLYIRREKIDLAIELRGDIRNIIIMWLMGAKYRLSTGSTGGKGLLTNIVAYSNERHLIENNWTILKYLGCYNESQKKPVLIYTCDEQRRFDVYLSNEKLKPYNYIIINPGASFSSRRWLESKFLELAHRLESKYEIPVIWNFPPGDPHEGYKSVNHIFSSTLSDLMPLLDQALFYVGLDSGVGHIAAAFNVPSVIIFGPQDPELSKPINNRLEVVIADKIECRPCGKKKCDKRVSCMSLIEVPNVTAAVERLEKHFPERKRIDQ